MGGGNSSNNTETRSLLRVSTLLRFFSGVYEYMLGNRVFFFCTQVFSGINYLEIKCVFFFKESISIINYCDWMGLVVVDELCPFFPFWMENALQIVVGRQVE